MLDPSALATLGQRHHRRPAAAVAADVLGHPGPRQRALGGVRAVVRALRQRRVRRLRRPPPRRRPARGRSSTRWPTRCSCSARCSRSSPTACSGSCPSLIIAAREFVISMYRSVVGARGVSVPASRLAKNKTLVQQLAVGFALAAADRRRRDVDRGRSSCGWPSCWRWCRGCDYLRRRGPSRRPRPSAWRPDRADVRRSAPCAVTSSPSAPSCCSVRSTTPTRRGSVSGWR